MSICQLNKDGYCSRHKTIHVGRLRELSQLDDELGERYRIFWDQMATPNQVNSFANDLLEFIRQGSPKVSDQQYTERLSICDNCEYVDKSIETWRCKLCGCNLQEGPLLPGRARWATKDCPYPSGSKWPRIALPVVSQPIKRSCCGG